jgi:uncharacterized protein YkwD
MKTKSSYTSRGMTRLALVFAILTAPLGADEGNDSWTHADYKRYTPATFRNHPGAGKPVVAGKADVALLGAAIHYASNEKRIRHGLAPLEPSRALNRCATWHSRQMGTRGFFSHDNPFVPTMRTPWQRMAAVGVPGGFRAENIAWMGGHRMTYLEAGQRIVGMWMKSPGHRANLLSRNYRHLGCGAYVDAKWGIRIIATQNFASEVPDR